MECAKKKGHACFMRRNYDILTCFSHHKGQVAEMTKRCTSSHTDVIFVVMDALVRIYEDDLIATENVTAMPWPPAILLHCPSHSSANRFAKMTRMTISKSSVVDMTKMMFAIRHNTIHHCFS